MTVNIYDDINKLENSFRSTEEYEKLKLAVEAVSSDSDSNELFKSFRDLQISLQQKQAQGEEITEQEMMDAQATAVAAQENPKILAMLEAEMSLSQIIDEVNRVLIKPVQSLYESM